MFKEVLEVRYTNEEQDTLYVLFLDDDKTHQEMYIESGGADHQILIDMGITDEKIIEQTAEWKKESARSIVDIAKEAAADEYKEELLRLNEAAMKAKAACLMANKEVLKIKADGRIAEERLLKIKANAKKQIADAKHSTLKHKALEDKLQAESLEKIKVLNKYVSDHMGNEKIEVAVKNLKLAISALNENEKAIEVAGNGKKYKTLIAALKANI